MSLSRTRSFEVVPPPAHAWWIMGLLLLLPVVVVVAVMVVPGKQDPQAPLASAIGLATIAVAAIACLLGLKRREVRLDGGTLRVVAGLFSRTLPVDSFDLQRARIVDLDERTELRPSVKTFGMSLPGYQAGHFRLRDRFGKAFCLLTERRRVLWLPQRDGKQQVLLSLAQPQALLDALRAAAH